MTEIWGRRLTHRPSVALESEVLLLSRWWLGFFALLALLGWALMCSEIYKSFLVYQQDAQFILILFWGCYLSLLLFMTTDNWIWELAENYPVKPVAAVVSAGTPPGVPVYTAAAYSRPSLNFYSDRVVMGLKPSQFRRHWQVDSQPYLLDEISLELSR